MHSAVVSRFSGLILLGFIVLSGCRKPSTPVATNPSWVKYAQNPILKRGPVPDQDFYAISDCFVLKENGLYKMWYTQGGLVAPDTNFHNSIGYALSGDGIHWTKYAQNPVLDVNPAGWDSLGIETVCLLVDSAAPAAERYKLWYAGQTAQYLKYNIGYAHSPDGIAWTKFADPVLVVGSDSAWDNGFLEGPSVIRINNQYLMWYTGYDAKGNGGVNIGQAVSTDGIHWTKNASNPIFTSGTANWCKQTVQDPAIIFYKGIYHMWYGGSADADHYAAQTGYASSGDGVHWTSSPNNPVLKSGTTGSWDANTASFPSVLIDADTLKIWYTGKSIEPIPAFGDYFWEIGYASKLLTPGLPIE